MADETIQPAGANENTSQPYTPAVANILSSGGASDAPGPAPMLSPGGANDVPDNTTMLTPASAQDPMTALHTSAAADPELQAAATHHGRLAQSLIDAASKLSSILGGDETFTVGKDKDGNPQVTKHTSTEGEKWGRVAATLLSGAAKGFAAGQGPGGAARAVNVGFDAGVQARQQQKTQAEHDVDVQQQQMLRQANLVKLNQENVKAGWDNAHLSRDDAQKQSDYAIEHYEKLRDAGVIPVAMNVKDHDTLTRFGVSDPLSVQAHMGANGEMLYNEPDGKGGVNFYRVPANVGKQLTTDDDRWTETAIDPKDPTKTIEIPHVSVAGTETYEKRLTRTMANTAHTNTVLKQAFDAKIAQQGKDIEGKKADTEEKLLPYRERQLSAAANASNAAAALHTAQKGLIAGGTGGNPSGLTGDAYLQAAGIDPSQWNQIKAAARGDVKMPTASRSPQNQAFRNAVMNYDPTFTDARYETKQNFKTKGDSAQLTNLSTAMEHLERATQNSSYIPFSPTAAAYDTDIKNFTHESGKLISAGVLTQHQYDELKDKMASALPYVRQAALKETTDLLGGRVNAIFNKYRVGAGQELPVQEFFDKPTQDRLTRYGIVQAPAAPAAAATPAAANTDQAARAPGGPAAAPVATPPANLVPPGHDVSFKNHGGVWRNVGGAIQKVSDN
jgi:hypothetical protein